MSEEKLIQLLKPLIKPTTRLILTASESAIPASCETKIGGLPYAEHGDEWAICSTCHNELTFIAQFKLPQEKTLHTFFYCDECFPCGQNNEIGRWQIRSYAQPDMENYVEIKSTQNNGFPVTACHCTEKLIQTLPFWSWEEGISPEIDSILEDRRLQNEGYGEYVRDVESLGCFVDSGIWIGGYPHWGQGDGTPSCSRCRTNMEFLIQFDIEDETEFSWSFWGALYLFRCSEHKDEFRLVINKG